MEAHDTCRLILPASQPQSLENQDFQAGLHAVAISHPERAFEIHPSVMTHLLAAARSAALNAYAPFSRFRVGAAVMMADDPARQLISGTNVENSSFGLTQCAERTALQSAASLGFRRLLYLALSCLDAAPTAPLAERSPCGACRQVIREFGGPETLVLIDRGTPDLTADVLDIERLFPFGFRFPS